MVGLTLEAAPAREERSGSAGLVSIEVPEVAAAVRLAEALAPLECDLFPVEALRWRVQAIGVGEVEPVLERVRAWLAGEGLAAATVVLDEGRRTLTVR